jgi:hypothetical protein
MQAPNEKSEIPRGEGSLGDIEIAVLIPLVLLADTILATISWYVVGLLR